MAGALFGVLAAAACSRPVAPARADAPPAKVRAETAAAGDPSATGAASEIPVVSQKPPLGRPRAIVDLAGRDGAAAVRAEWRYSDVRIDKVIAKGPGPDLRPSGAPIATHDYAPKAGAADFDDSAWPVVDPATLDARRGQGKLSFGWYRLRLTLPERVGDVELAGSTVAFEIVIDDYAEIWVDGKLSRRLGESGGSVVAGFNHPNRVILTRSARPGQEFTIAVFGMNGPISAAPDNFIWIRSATLDIHDGDNGDGRRPSYGSVERLDPALDAIFDADARVEKLAGGFQFVEGPLWNPAENALLFSDPNQNVIYRYDTDGALGVFRTKSGYKGFDVGKYHQPGSNGLAIDRDGRVTIDEHGNRRVTRLEPNGALTVLADNYQGKRLNSPNDLVYKRDGSLYFTDPPFGLPKGFEDPNKDLAYSGVFRWAEGKLTLLTKDLTGPNGLAFSPDEKYLYVDNWDPKRKVVMRYRVQEDGTLANGSVFFDMTSAPGEEALDGLKVDQNGNLFVSGPGGIWILSEAGKQLGMLRVAELPANFAWGGPDRRSLYMTARTGLYRITTKIKGAGAFWQ
jgi:gluconolactonase